MFSIKRRKDSYSLYDQDKGVLSRHTIGYPATTAVTALASNLYALDAASTMHLPQALHALAGSAMTALRQSSSIILRPVLEKGLVELRRILHLETTLWFGREDWTSGEVRNLTTVSGMKKSVVFTLEDQYRDCILTVDCAYQNAMQSRLDFISFGKSAAGISPPDRYTPELASLMGWWATYFRARAVLLAKASDYSGAMQNLNREIELMLQAVALEHRLVSLSSSGEIVGSGKKLSGLGQLIQLVRPNLERVVEPHVVDALTQAVACRNRSRMGHGVAGLSTEIFDFAAATLSQLWRNLAEIGSNGSAKVVRKFAGKAPATLFPNAASLLSDIALKRCRTLPKVTGR